MNARTKARYTARARILKALAHPTRLFIVDQLADGRRCVCELTGMVSADFSTVSKHLAVLKNAGIVDDRKQGNLVYYNLRTPCVLKFLDCVETVIKTNVRRQLQLLK